MKVVYRLTLLMLLAALLVLLVYGALTIRREAQMFESTMVEDARHNGQTLCAALEEIARSDGMAGVERVIADAGSAKLEFRGLRGPAVAEVGLTDAERSQLAAGREVVRIEPGEPGRLCLYFPFQLLAGETGLLEMRESLQREEAYVAESLTRIAWATVLLIGLSGGLSFLIGYRVVGRPLLQLEEKIRRVGRGDLSGDVELGQSDEIGELGQALNAVCAQLAAEMEQRRTAETQLRHAERLATVGMLASGLAHELGTPLSVIMGRGLQIADELKEDPGQESPESLKAAEIIVAQAERMSGIIRQLLDFARAERKSTRTIDPRALLDEICGLLEPMAQQAKVAISTEVGEGLPEVSGDPDLLRQAMTNLVVNGIQAMPKGGGLTVTAGVAEATPPRGDEPRTCLVLAVQDEGAGIPVGERERVFEPFFTTKDVGNGTGLGLAITQEIVVEHGGWITVESELGVGTRFAVHLPGVPT